MSVKLNIWTPFDHCQDCDMFEIVDDKISSMTDVYHSYSCKHQLICRNAAGVAKADIMEPIEEHLKCKDCEYWPYQNRVYADNQRIIESFEWCSKFPGDGYCFKAEKRKEE